jgi:hypothetical protein
MSDGPSAGLHGMNCVHGNGIFCDLLTVKCGEAVPEECPKLATIQVLDLANYRIQNGEITNGNVHYTADYLERMAADMLKLAAKVRATADCDH